MNPNTILIERLWVGTRGREAEQRLAELARDVQVELISTCSLSEDRLTIADECHGRHLCAVL